MARSWFGGTSSDLLLRPYSLNMRTLLELNTATVLVTFWNAASGGTQYTDLQTEDGTPVPWIQAVGGILPRFKGPDGVTGMWYDLGSGIPRALVEARDVAAATELAADVEAAKNAAEDAADAAAAAAATATAATASKVDKGSLVLNVEDYGAVAGGSAATNLTAFQAAIAAAPTGGTVYVPAGNFGLSGDLAITASLVLRGAGDRSILTVVNGGLVFDGSAALLTEVGLHDLRISRFGTVGPALRFAGGGSGKGVVHFNVSNVNVVGSTGECLLIDGSYIGVFTGCYFVAGVTGIKIAMDPTGLVVSGNNISFVGGETQGCGTAVSLARGYGVNFYGHAFEGSTVAGVDVTDDAYGIGFYGCYWESNPVYDLRVGNTATTTGPVGLVVHGGFFEDAAGAKTNSIILIRGLGVEIRGNAFFNYGAEPVKVLEASAGAVRGEARNNTHNGNPATATVAYNGADQFNKTTLGQHDATATVAGSPITLHKTYTITHDFGSIAAGATAEVSLTATGVLTGDDVAVHTNDLEAGLIPYACSVTAADTIKLRVANVSAGAIDPPARNWRFRVWR